MSVLCTFPNGWIISHDAFFRRVYENVEGNPNKKLVYDPCLFHINTPFVRLSFKSEDISVTVVNEPTSSKSRRKRRHTTTNDVDVEHVKQNFMVIIEEGKKLGHFTYVPTPKDRESNNLAARDKAHSFYVKYPISSAVCLHGENNLNKCLVTQVNGENYVVPASCKFFSYDVTDIDYKMDLLMPPFDLVLLDPPWWNKYIRRKKAKCMKAGYQMMYSEDLIDIPVPALTAPGSLVAVWCTNSISHHTCLRNEIFPAWEVEYIGKWFWQKVTRAGEPVCQFSSPPGKQPFEQIVFGYRRGASRKQPMPETNRVIVSIPSAIHSHKPPLSEVLAPYLPINPRCMEVFARYLLPGWTSWGNEVLKLQHLSLYIDEGHESNFATQKCDGICPETSVPSNNSECGYNE